MLVHQAQQGSRSCTAVPVHEHLSLHRDMCDTLDARRRTYRDAREEASHSYHPHHGGRYDSSEDQSSSPNLPGPQTFGRHILNAVFPPRYRPPTNIPKYSGKQTLNYGSRIIDLLVKLVERIMTTSLSAIFHCSWLIQRERGWNTFRPTESKVGRT